MQNPIRVVNRATGKVFDEKVYGDWGVKFLYQTGPGYLLERSLLSRRPFSQLYGLYNNSGWSARRIPQFVQDFNIPLQDFNVPPAGFAHFNDFFIRTYKPNLRPFPTDPKLMGSPAEGRVLAYQNIDENNLFPIKGQCLSLGRLLGGEQAGRRYHGGAAYIIRLCPVDYHRYHFPDAGTPGEATRISGAYHSVNPVALQRRPTLFQENERMVTFFESKNFGQLALMEVGALCVGRMVQSFVAGQQVSRGQEKGYFTFGASTCVLFAEPGRIKVPQDLLDNTQKGMESLIALGEVIATGQ